MILNKADYKKKMGELLSDGYTYMKMQARSAKKEAEDFKKKARKILTRTEEGKALLGLLEEAPRPPRMRGLPKVHKPDHFRDWQCATQICQTTSQASVCSFGDAKRLAPKKLA